MYNHRKTIQIKWTHYDDAKKMAHDSQIVRAKENLKFTYGGPSQRQASGTNQRIKALRMISTLYLILLLRLIIFLISH